MFALDMCVIFHPKASNGMAKERQVGARTNSKALSHRQQEYSRGASTHTPSTKLSKFLQEHGGNTYMERSEGETPAPQGGSDPGHCQGTGGTGAPQPRASQGGRFSHRPDTGASTAAGTQAPHRLLRRLQQTPPPTHSPEGSAVSGRRRATPPRAGERALRQDPTARRGRGRGEAAAGAPERGRRRAGPARPRERREEKGRSPRREALWGGGGPHPSGGAAGWE